MRIRPERESDFDDVRRVNELAFGRPGEARLIDRLRSSLGQYISLVAEIDSSVIGHIFFSPMSSERRVVEVNIWGLAPMAVLPDHQRRGVGSELIREGIGACLERGVEAVFVLGHPDYYPMFGFREAAEYGVQSEFDVPQEAFMVRELQSGSLSKLQGVVRYHHLFGEAD